jgi:hypothetical protein
MLIDASTALTTKLSTLASAPPIAYEDTEYTPTVGELYLIEKLKPVLAMPMFMTGAYAEQIGIYTINIMYPRGNTRFPALNIAENLRQHFMPNTTITENGTDVNLQRVEVKPSYQHDSNWNVRPVDVHYRFYA